MQETGRELVQESCQWNHRKLRMKAWKHYEINTIKRDNVAHTKEKLLTNTNIAIIINTTTNNNNINNYNYNNYNNNRLYKVFISSLLKRFAMRTHFKNVGIYPVYHNLLLFLNSSCEWASLCVCVLPQIRWLPQPFPGTGGMWWWPLLVPWPWLCSWLFTWPSCGERRQDSGA